jgi:hypothetical protein
VSPSRYHVEADSIDALNARILDTYGPDAAVVATTVTTTGGLQGFFASRKFHATVELADGSPGEAHVFDLPSRAGIAALLDRADIADGVDTAGAAPANTPGPAYLPAPAYAPAPPAGPQPPAEPGPADTAEQSRWAVSTSTNDFAAILSDLTLNTASAVPAIRPPSPASPSPLRGAGDLVVVIGLGDDALAVAKAIADGVGASVLRIAGLIDRDGIERVDDRRGAIAARAAGVRGGRGVVVAFGLPRGGPTSASFDELASLNADQFWVAVDAGRKPEDSARWVRAVSEAVPLVAVMSWAPEETGTPHSVAQLGLPVGWLEAGW